MPTACRLSQTLGHASSLIMKARLQFVAPHERSRKTQLAAGASSSERSLKAAEKVGSGCPRFGGHRTVPQLERKRMPSTYPSISCSPSKYKASGRSHCVRHESWRILVHQSSGSVQASVEQLSHPALVRFAIQIQSKVAAPRARPNPSFKRTRLRHAA